MALSLLSFSVPSYSLTHIRSLSPTCSYSFSLFISLPLALDCSRDDADTRHTSNPRPIVPEPFCWHLLRSLAEAALLLEAGRTDPTPLDHPDWTALFHYDVKPLNILLGTPNREAGSQYWQQNYPTPILADFGGVESYPTPQDPDQIPEEVLARQTVGYRPFVSD